LAIERKYYSSRNGTNGAPHLIVPYKNTVTVFAVVGQDKRSIPATDGTEIAE